MVKYRKPPSEQGQRKKSTKYVVERLKDEEIADRFQRRINKKINGNDSDIQTRWMEFERIMMEGAQILKENRQDTKIKSWFDEQCKEAILRREKARMEMIKTNTTKSREQYGKYKKEAKHMYRAKKREHIQKQMENLENTYVKKQIREFYKGVKTERTKGQQSKVLFFKDKQGQLVGGSQGSLERWVDIFKRYIEKKKWKPQMYST